MNTFDLIFFGLCALLVLLGGVITVAAKNPIRGAMGLLVSIIGIAGNYLLLHAELLATTQVLVYAGAVVILFVFVIMILGPSATSPHDARSAIPRYIGAGALLVSAITALGLLAPSGDAKPTLFVEAPKSFGTIEGLGHDLFTTAVVPFELASALLLIAVIGAVAVARGKQNVPTGLQTAQKAPKKATKAPSGHADASETSAHSAGEAHP